MVGTWCKGYHIRFGSEWFRVRVSVFPAFVDLWYEFNRYLRLLLVLSALPPMQMSQPISATRGEASTKPDKVLITGTGRCGTTFLIRLFTLLGLDTGYMPETMEKHTWKHCNAGMERPISHKLTFIKNPTLITTLATQVKSFNLFVIIPLRDFGDAARSRALLGKNPGGLWGATDASGQEENYEKWVCKALVDIVQNDIPHVFLDFNRMTTSPDYLYKALEPLMQKYGVTYERFQPAWRRADEISKPKPETRNDLSGVTVMQTLRAF
jgi:hypothetical protein